MAISALLIALVYGAHKGNKLAGNDPVEITVLNLFIVFVLFHVEGVEIVPSSVYSKLETFYTVLNGALIETLSLAGITEGF